MKNLRWVLFLFLLVNLSSVRVFAQSTYVLPYPSQMPGNKFYTINQVIEKLSYYWYFGNFGKTYYYQRLSDKYFVEAKTLFEYKQYLLAYKSLLKSNQYFEKSYPHLLSAKKEGKDISEKQEIFRQGSLKHIEELYKLKKTTPGEFLWTPEKSKPTRLNIRFLIDTSENIRKKYL
jgi:hypothetical protein